MIFAETEVFYTITADQEERKKLISKLSTYGFNWNPGKQEWFIRKEKVGDKAKLLKLIGYKPPVTFVLPDTQAEAEDIFFRLAYSDGQDIITGSLEKLDRQGSREGFFAPVRKFYGRWVSFSDDLTRVHAWELIGKTFACTRYKLEVTPDLLALLRRALVTGYIP